jgi:hypothetical protein
VDEYNHRLEAALASIYVKPEDTTTEDKIYDAISIEYTKNLLKHMRTERDKYKLIEAKLKERNVIS